jgi:hypothetical protein
MRLAEARAAWAGMPLSSIPPGRQQETRASPPSRQPHLLVAGGSSPASGGCKRPACRGPACGRAPAAPAGCRRRLEDSWVRQIGDQRRGRANEAVQTSAVYAGCSHWAVSHEAAEEGRARCTWPAASGPSADGRAASGVVGPRSWRAVTVSTILLLGEGRSIWF